MSVAKPLKIKVIHISTGYNGGAALAARRLNESLNSSGFESHFGAISQKGYSPSESEFEIPRSAFSRLVSGIVTSLQINLSKKVFFSLFSMHVLPKNVITARGNKDNTVLHFHNWFNLTNQKEIAQWAKKGYKVVVTMHDQRMMTGGCHYAFSCKGLYSNCKPCPELSKPLNRIPNLNLKRVANDLAPISGNVTFISPSRWLDSEAKKSYLLGNQRTIFIPNTLGNLQSSTRKLSAQSGKKLLNIGIASMDPNSYIKGGDITVSLEKLVREQGIPIVFHYMKDFQQTNNGIEIFWSEIDYLMVISRADNSPNVIHEAKQRGIPVVASKVGGITELLDSEFDVGLELVDCTESKLLQVLNNLISKIVDPSLKEGMHERYRKYIGLSVDEHISMYEDLFLESKN